MNLQNNDKINSILKKIVIFLGIGILGMGFLMVSVYINKKAAKANNNNEIITKTINKGPNRSFDNSFEKCNDTLVVVEDNYISISSKSCNLIKIIPAEKASLRK